MSGAEVLSKVDKGYRMPRPTGGVAGCSDAFYEMVEKCWKRSPEQRPTFAYLHSFFDDFFINIEPNYQGPDIWETCRNNGQVCVHQWCNQKHVAHFC